VLQIIIYLFFLGRWTNGKRRMKARHQVRRNQRRVRPFIRRPQTHRHHPPQRQPQTETNNFIPSMSPKLLSTTQHSKTTTRMLCDPHSLSLLSSSSLLLSLISFYKKIQRRLHILLLHLLLFIIFIVSCYSHVQF
jgi:hypothetical protein